MWEERRALWSARMCPPRGCRSTLATLLDAKRELLVVEDECKGRLRHVRELAACLSLVARGPRAAHRRLVVVSDSSKRSSSHADARLLSGTSLEDWQEELDADVNERLHLGVDGVVPRLVGPYSSRKLVPAAHNEVRKGIRAIAFQQGLRVL